jgi:hypothetical protein
MQRFAKHGDALWGQLVPVVWGSEEILIAKDGILCPA